MDLPDEALSISDEELAQIKKDVQDRIQKGRQEYENYILCLKNQGYSEEELESLID